MGNDWGDQMSNTSIKTHSLVNEGPYRTYHNS